MSVQTPTGLKLVTQPTEQPRSSSSFLQSIQRLSTRQWPDSASHSIIGQRLSWFTTSVIELEFQLEAFNINV